MGYKDLKVISNNTSQELLKENQRLENIILELKAQLGVEKRMVKAQQILIDKLMHEQSAFESNLKEMISSGYMAE